MQVEKPVKKIKKVSLEAFELAAVDLQDYFKGGKDTSNDNKLALHKYYKQGGVGDVNT